MNEKRALFQEEQENMIMTLLKRSGHVSVAEICKYVGISASTARIRLSSMDERGFLMRTHGGAIEKNLSLEGKAHIPVVLNLREKQAVAKEAVKTVNEGDIIAIGGGVTTLVFARELHGIKNLTVVTSSIFVANELVIDPDIKVHISGGVLSTRSGGCQGERAEKFFDSISVSKSYNSVDSVTPEYGFTLTHTDNRTEKCLVACSRHKYTLVDHTKLYMSALLESISSFDEVEALIIDEKADPVILDKLREAGLNIIVAKM